MLNITKVEKNKKALKVKWSDGEESTYNYLWLRDNCPTAHDKDSNHRMFNILNDSENLQVKNFKITDKNRLVVEWSEGSHVSHYDTKWLRENCYTLKNKKKYISPSQLWNSTPKDKINSINFNIPKVDIVSNITASPEKNPNKIKKLLIDQIFSTVRWRESIELIQKNGGIINHILSDPDQ